MFINNLLSLPAWFEENLVLIIVGAAVILLFLIFVIFILIKRIKNKKGVNSTEDASTKQKTEGRYTILQSDNSGKFHFELKAPNNQVIFSSRDYSSKATCKQGITSFRAAVSGGTFSINQDKSGRFNFRLQKGSQVYEGETVTTKALVEKAIESIKKNASTPKIVD